ncbi:MAG: PmoA family protein [Bacteroidota bacterium]
MRRSTVLEFATCCWVMPMAVLVGLLSTFTKEAYGQKVDFHIQEQKQLVEVNINGTLFTAYRFPGELEKPVLYPLLTASGIPVTRGYPLEPRAGERVDHPHHVGMWFNFGDVNGLDFWNNSFAITEKEKPNYGRIRHQRTLQATGGNEGVLKVLSYWVDHREQLLLKETTTFRFRGDGNLRIMDRTTELEAVVPVEFKDNKEGLLAIRMDRAFEEPVTEPEIFTDASGKPTTIASMNNEGVNGIYRSSTGLVGGAVWGHRADWVSLTATKAGEEITVALFDHSGNFGYPAHWHARTYGLFSVNNIGSRVFNPTDPQQRFKLEKGKSVVFRHRLVIGPASALSQKTLDNISQDFRLN